MQKNLVRYILWGGVAALVVAALVFAFRPQPIAVDFVTITEDQIRITVADEGMAEVHEVYRISAPVAGRLLRVQGEVGDTVVAGKSEIAGFIPRPLCSLMSGPRQRPVPRWTQRVPVKTWLVQN